MSGATGVRVKSAGAVQIQQEFLGLCQHEVEPLAREEWAESGHPTDLLCIDWDAYAALENRDALRFFAARAEGRLVGYAVVLLFVPLTLKGSQSAIIDSIYVAKEARGIGIRLLSFVESCLREDGVDRLIASSSAKNPIDALLTRRGYVEIETKFERKL